MKGHELFGVIVRVIGVSLLVSALWTLTATIYEPKNLLAWIYALVPTVPIALLGFVFFRYANRVVRLAYPEEFR